MTRHILLGYGYVASYLAEILIHKNQRVVGISRKIPKNLPNSLQYFVKDIRQEPLNLQKDDFLYYFIPPLHEYSEDITMIDFLNQLTTVPQKIIYIGSSGIYGHHQGQWVDEQSPCHIETLRQKQRLSAESHLLQFCQKHQIPCARLRVAGIYGPQRIPFDAVYAQSPVIYPQEAPFINHIYIHDLAHILAYLGMDVTYHGILNIADGTPSPMGTLQQQCAQILKYPQAPHESFSHIWNSASHMKKEFMSQNKKLNIERLQQILKPSYIQLTPMHQALKKILEV